jgi:hypothetical protein
MSEIMRLFQSAVDPSDIDEVRRLFNDDVRPVFEKIEQCRGIDLLVNVEESAGGLIEGCALSRWASVEGMNDALASRAVGEALVRIRTLLRQEPVTKTFQVLD